MANNKMLIDASHPEETRVVVVRGNRIEEFDFEAQERRQLRGNIYLAKVTRVEPSLQAAFIDYGGNRHGFLAFSEIHPDYYQIPAADRQALLEADEAEAAEAAEQEDEEEGLDAAVGEGTEATSEDEDDAQPKKRGRKRPRRGGKFKKAKDETVAASEEIDEAETSNSDADVESDASDAHEGKKASAEKADAESDKTSDAEVEAEAEPKKTPRKRTSRPRKTKSEVTEEAAAGSEEASDNDEDSGSKTMAAMMEIDSISEPAGDEENADDNAQETSGVEADSSGAEETPTPKKKTKRPTRRKTAKKVSEEKSEEASEAAEEQETVSENADNAETTEAEADSAAPEKEEPKKKRRTSRGRKSSKKAKAEADVEGSDSDESEAPAETAEPGEKVESVGQEDALEEVPVRRPRRQYKIQEVIRRRQVMLVQVVKEERGNKGAALTTYLSLAGRYSVLMPNTARGGGISRKITNPGDRKRLKEIANSLEVPKGMGVILRTAGASRDKEEITRDFEYLMRLWENVRNLTLESSAPFLVYEEGSLIKRSIRDLYNKDIGEIIVSGENGYREATDFMKMMMPEHVKNIKFYQGEQSLLSRFNVEGQLEKMVTPQVTLRSGGYLIINQTEALVAIDVNSGRSTREHSIEATALQTNLEAAEEVARQLRLRDLAGLVVIDFIDMEEKRNNRAVERKLKDCLKNDRARIQVGHISHFGLLEMSRQRIRASVLESTMAVCPVCQGVGHVRSESSFAIHVLRSIDDHLNKHSRFDVVVKVAPATAMYIFNHKRKAVSELEDRYGVNIEFESDFHMQVHEFTIEKGEPATRAPIAAKAVNPMDFTDDTSHEGSDNIADDTNGHEPNGEDDTRSSKRGKKRRGRGRNRNRDREETKSEEANTEHGSDSSDQNADRTEKESSVEAASSDSTDAPADGETKEAPEKERKPSPGRRTKRAKAEAEEEPSAKAEISAEENLETDEEASNEPTRRTGRPGKKVKSADASQNADSSQSKAEASSTGPNGAPPREVKRRNTKRVRKPKEDSEAPSDDADQPSSFNDGFLS